MKNYYRGKKVLVTGHTGFKGTWLCRILSLMGADIYGYALMPPTTPNLYELLNADDFVTSEIEGMGIMFAGCSSLTSLDLSSFDTSKVIHMDHLFSGCKNLE